VEVRRGPYLSTAVGIQLPVIYPCKDGYIHVLVAVGSASGIADSMKALTKWMDEEGMLPDELRGIDFATYLDPFLGGQEGLDRFINPFRKFFLTKTKAEFHQQSLTRQIMGCAVMSLKDAAESPHLAARDYWQKVEHPELGATLTYCGPFAKLSEAPVADSAPPPSHW